MPAQLTTTSQRTVPDSVTEWNVWVHAITRDLRAGSLQKQTKTVKDFRRILDDGSVDALVCAAPNHWHAPATIMACNAGKHVYVEKPCSHNPWEGETMVAAARKHK